MVRTAWNILEDMHNLFMTFSPGKKSPVFRRVLVNVREQSFVTLYIENMYSRCHGFRGAFQCVAKTL